MMKEIILITGANGHLAQMLGNYLKDEYDVRYLSRKKNNLPSYYYWDIDKKVIEINALKGCSHIIHLAGYPILNKWTVKNKELMYNSRVNSSKLLFDKCQEQNIIPKTFITASAMGIYDLNNTEKINENSSKGSDWLAQLAVDWETASHAFKSIGCRVIQLRISLIFSKYAGYLKYNLLAMKFGIAGMIGNKHKTVNWIEINDLIKFIKKGITSNDINGPYNLACDDQLSQLDIVNTVKKFLYPYCINIRVPIYITKLFLGERIKIINSNVKLDMSKLKQSGFRCECDTFSQLMNHLK